MESNGAALAVVAFFSVIAVTVCIAAYLYYFRLWFRALVAHAPVPLLRIAGMVLRRVSPHVVVNAYIRAHKAGLTVTLDEIEELHLAQGNVRRVVEAMVASQTNGKALGFKEASSIDLQGRDVLQEVRASKVKSNIGN